MRAVRGPGRGQRPPSVLLVRLHLLRLLPHHARDRPEDRRRCVLLDPVPRLQRRGPRDQRHRRGPLHQRQARSNKGNTKRNAFVGAHTRATNLHVLWALAPNPSPKRGESTETTHHTRVSTTPLPPHLPPRSTYNTWCSRASRRIQTYAKSLLMCSSHFNNKFGKPVWKFGMSSDLRGPRAGGELSWVQGRGTIEKSGRTQDRKR